MENLSERFALERALEDPGEIAFDDCPPQPGPELFIKRLKGNEEIKVICYANKPRGVYCHWYNGRTQPHYKNAALCPGCKGKIRVDWKGYLHGFCCEMNAQVFLELTPFSAKALERIFPKGFLLRGSKIRVGRTKADNGRLRIWRDADERILTDLPPERDPMPSILRLWGLESDESEEEIGKPLFDQPAPNGNGKH